MNSFVRTSHWTLRYGCLAGVVATGGCEKEKENGRGGRLPSVKRRPPSGSSTADLIAGRCDAGIVSVLALVALLSAGGLMRMSRPSRHSRSEMTTCEPPSARAAAPGQRRSVAACRVCTWVAGCSRKMASAGGGGLFGGGKCGGCGGCGGREYVTFECNILWCGGGGCGGGGGGRWWCGVTVLATKSDRSAQSAITAVDARPEL